MTQPCFLVAARRSGTTLFRLMIGGHPDVIWQRGWEEVADATAAVLSKPTVTQTVQMASFLPVTANSVPELRHGLETEIDKILARENKTCFGATVHVDFKKTLEIWPDAKFIHLIRDPRDIAISFLNLGWANHYLDSADGWETAERDWDEMLPQLRDDQFIDVNYETLVSEPEAEMKRVCNFLQLNYTDDVFSYVKTSSYSMPQKSLAYRWKKQLDEEAVRQIESGRHAIINSRHYEAEYEDTDYTAWQIFKFTQQGIWKRRKKRVRENGIIYIVAGKIARRFNIKSLGTWVEKGEIEKRQKNLDALEKKY